MTSDLSRPPAAEESASVKDASARIRVTLPTSIPGVNAFIDDAWWQNSLGVLDALGATRDDTGFGTGQATEVGFDRRTTADTATAPAWSGVVMFATPMRDRAFTDLAGADTGAVVTAIGAWTQRVLKWAERGPVALVVADRPPEDLSALLDHLSGSVRHSPKPAGLLDREGSGPAEAFEEGLCTELELDGLDGPTVAETAARYALAAMQLCFARVPLEGQSRIRKATWAALDELRRSGVVIRGPRTGMIWPTGSSDALHKDIAAEVCLAVVHGFVDRADDSARVSTEFDETRRELAGLQHQVRDRRAELSRIQTDPRHLSRVPGRSLLRLLLRRRRG